MKLGLAQINTTVGDLSGNKAIILDAYHRLVEQGAELIIFPELAVCGYPPRDLLLKSRFANDAKQSLESIAQEITSVPALIGCLEIAPSEQKGRPLYNAVAWCESGSIQSYGRKCLLPNYDVFDEERYFEPAIKPLVYQWKGKRIGITICEDIWTAEGVQTSKRYCNDPVENLSKEDLDLLVNLSASPWHTDKEHSRQNLIEQVSHRLKCPVVYCNSVGGNDELIFDGDSFITHPSKGIIAQMPKFKQSLKTFDLETSTHTAETVCSESTLKYMYDALVLGLKDYAHKSNFTKGIIGLSGGIDSAVVAAIAAEALGADNIIGVAMPSAISSGHSISDAQALAENLKIEFQNISIKGPVESIEAQLAPSFKALEKDVTEENIQARLRGVLLMALSNKLNALLLTTGNKSEIAVGYCTLYGDMCGGLAVISDLPKMQVYALANYINRDGILIPQNTIEKAPSAELSPDQKDEDSLPPYSELDAILHHYVEEGLSRAEIIKEGFDSEIVNFIVKKVDQNEYKRKQAAPGLKISPLAFGIGRRMPIVQKYIN
ncbi:MAG: NAD+ synthase [Coraliomargaritaceae bacterium]